MQLFVRDIKTFTYDHEWIGYCLFTRKLQQFIDLRKYIFICAQIVYIIISLQVKLCVSDFQHMQILMTITEG